jgi:hypothetical protein
VDGLEDVGLDKVMAYVTGCAKNGFKRRVRVLWEMRVDDGRKKRPAGIPCPFDADSVYARVLVEERVHVMSRKGNDVVGVGVRLFGPPMPETFKYKSNAGRKLISSPLCLPL